MLFILLGLLLAISACDKENELTGDSDPPVNENSDEQGQDDTTPQDSMPDTNGQIDPDIIANNLALKDAITVNGDLPAALDGQILIDVKDTIFLVKGYPFGDRIQLLPESGQASRTNRGGISGMYVQVLGSTFYHNVPSEAVETIWVDEFGDHRTTYTFDLDLDLSDLGDISYPFSIEIKLQPYDEAGTPLDEFERVVTIEDPEDSAKCDDIRREPGTSDNVWVWDYSIRAYNGQILNVIAPGLAAAINSIGGGCCLSDGRSVTTSEDNLCFEDTTAPERTWVELELDDYSVRTFEVMWFYTNGLFDFGGIYRNKQYDRSITNFCTGIAGYTFDREDYGIFDGGHDFMPGATSINLDVANWFGPYRMFSSYDLIYTCNTLLLMNQGGDDEWTFVYRKLKSGDNPTAFDTQFKPWFE